MVPPIVTVTLQSSALAALSNILAQLLTAYRNNEEFIPDWVPVFQFFVFALVNTPPNFLWQEYLEETFPAYGAASSKKAKGSSDSDGHDYAKTGQQGDPKPTTRKLNGRNTLTKVLLDQSVGAFANTLLFSVFHNSLQAAMVGAPRHTANFLAHPGAIDYSRVSWPKVLGRARAEFWTIMLAGWRFWPAVSLFNFAVVRSVATRNLIGALAGVAWGVYMSLFAAR